MNDIAIDLGATLCKAAAFGIGWFRCYDPAALSMIGWLALTGLPLVVFVGWSLRAR